MIYSKFAKLTETLTEAERDELLGAAEAVGATESDLELYIERHCHTDVTSRNLHIVIFAFKDWYQQDITDEEWNICHPIESYEEDANMNNEAVTITFFPPLPCCVSRNGQCCGEPATAGYVHRHGYDACYDLQPICKKCVEALANNYKIDLKGEGDEQKDEVRSLE